MATINSIGTPLITLGDTLTLSGAFPFVGTLTGSTSVIFPTSGTLATTAVLPTPAALTKVDDLNVTLTLGGTPATALLEATSITAGWTGELSVPRGGTGAATFNAYSVLCAGITNTGAFQNVSGLGTLGHVLTSNGLGLLPTWQAAPGAFPSALTGVDDTNITLTLGGSPASALLQAASITAGWSGTLSATRGGTGVNNGANTATFAGNLNFASSFTTFGAFAVTQTYTGITSVTFPTSGTLATTAQIPTPSALTKVDDTNITLTLGGTPSTALLQATSITAGWAGTLPGTRGGTGVNNGSSTITLGGSLTTSGSFASTFTMTGITAVTFPTSGTLATTSQLAVPAALTANDDTNVTLTLGGTPATALLQSASISAGWNGVLALTRGGTGASLAASNGGIVYTNASNFVILAGVATAGRMLQSGAVSAPTWSTATFPSTTTINQLLYSSAANVVGGVTVVNGAGLLTTAGGVPTWVGYTGTGAPVLSTNPSILNPIILTSIRDSNNTVIVSLTPVVSAVNFVDISNAVTTGSPLINVIGTDANISLQISGKGTGGVNVSGKTDGVAIGAGFVGNVVSANVPLASAVVMTSTVTRNVTSITVPAGSWRIMGNVTFDPGTNITRIAAWTSTTTATLPDLSLISSLGLGALGSGGNETAMTTPLLVLDLAATTTVYLSVVGTFTGAFTASGSIFAVRA